MAAETKVNSGVFKQRVVAVAAGWSVVNRLVAGAGRRVLTGTYWQAPVPAGRRARNKMLV